MLYMHCDVEAYTIGSGKARKDAADPTESRYSEN